MKAYLFYNRNTPAERTMNDLSKRLEEEQVDVELMDADSRAGIDMAQAYDILGRPAVALIRDDGSPVQVWQGEDSLPAVTDVAYLAHQ